MQHLERRRGFNAKKKKKKRTVGNLQGYRLLSPANGQVENFGGSFEGDYKTRRRKKGRKLHAIGC